MALLNFPNTRQNGSTLQNGDEYIGDNGVTYIYNTGKWTGYGDGLNTGTAATIRIGTVTTGSASVTNTGSIYNAYLNFTIPQGLRGELGPQGDTGAQGISLILVGSTDTVSVATVGPGAIGQGWIGTDTGHVYFWNTLTTLWEDIGPIVGPAGPRGLPGFQGEQGPIGPSGATGLQGEQGTQGPQGVVGLRGATGVLGPSGPQGNQGAQGNQGLQGNTGVSGVQGPQGTQGPQGPYGLSGPQGPQGNQGSTGSQGTAGYTGSTGASGSQGDQGPQGPYGLSGPQGPRGATGPQGPQGAASTVSGPQGPLGVSGPSGPTGATGPQGPQGAASTVSGPQGPSGANGTSVNILGQFTTSTSLSGVSGPALGDGYIVSFDGHLWVYTGTGTVSGFSDVGQITGPSGVQGPMGPQGAQGTGGVQGPQGPQGATGPMGPQGVSGPQGAEGPQGPQGVRGVQGPQGAAGNNGSNGPQGVSGPQGPSGSSSTTVTVSDTAPTATTGTQWFNTVDGRTYIAYNGQWVDASPVVVPQPSTYLDEITIDGSTININDNTLTISNTGTLLINGSEVTGGGGVSVSNHIEYTDPNTDYVSTLDLTYNFAVDVDNAHLDINGDGYWEIGSNAFDTKIFSTDDPGNEPKVIVVRAGDEDWTFGPLGALTLPQGSTISEIAGDSSSYGILLTPYADPQYNPDMAVKIYPTFNDDDHIHITAGDPTTVDLFLGDDDQYVKLEQNHGNIVIGTNTTVSNSTWTFGTDGVLTLSTASTILGNNADPNVYIETATAGTTNTWTFAADGVLTFPNTNLQIGELYGLVGMLGGTDALIGIAGQGNSGAVGLQWLDDLTSATSVASVILNNGLATSSGTVQIWTGIPAGPSASNVWEFGTDGSLTLPQGGIIDETPAVETLTLVGANLAVVNQTYTKTSLTLYTGSDGVTIEEISPGVWFIIQGGDTKYSSADDLITWSDSTGGLPVPTGTINTLPETVNITVGTETWTFVADGSTTLPIGVSIDEYYGSHFPRIVADTGKAFSVQGQGSTGSVALQWIETESTSSRIAQVGLNKLSGVASVTLTAGTSTNDMKVWRFDETGSTTFPDSTVQTTAYPGVLVPADGDGVSGIANMVFYAGTDWYNTSKVGINPANGFLTLSGTGGSGGIILPNSGTIDVGLQLGAILGLTRKIYSEYLGGYALPNPTYNDLATAIAGWIADATATVTPIYWTGIPEQTWELTGYFRAPEDGTYTFNVSADDYYFIVIDGDISPVPEINTPVVVALTRGQVVSYKVLYANVAGSGTLDLQWKNNASQQSFTNNLTGLVTTDKRGTVDLTLDNSKWIFGTDGTTTVPSVAWNYVPTTFTAIPVTYGATQLTFTVLPDNTFVNMSVAVGAGGYGPDSYNLTIPGTTFPGGTTPANDIVFNVTTFESAGPVFSTDPTSVVTYVSGAPPLRYDNITSAGSVGIGAGVQHWTFGANGTLTFPNNTVQTTAFTTSSYISKETLKSIVADSTDFANFQTRIAAL